MPDYYVKEPQIRDNRSEQILALGQPPDINVTLSKEEIDLIVESVQEYALEFADETAKKDSSERRLNNFFNAIFISPVAICGLLIYFFVFVRDTPWFLTFICLSVISMSLIYTGVERVLHSRNFKRIYNKTYITECDRKISSLKSEKQEIKDQSLRNYKYQIDRVHRDYEQTYQAVVRRAQDMEYTLKKSIYAETKIRDIEKELRWAEISISSATRELKAGAAPLFWDHIDESIIHLIRYTEYATELGNAKKNYLNAIGICQSERYAHNFPLDFPVKFEISPQQQPSKLREELQAIIYEAFKNPHFSTIWEIRKTQKILISGFNTLEQAVKGVGYKVNEANSLLYGVLLKK